jgi:hypothetical protein
MMPMALVRRLDRDAIVDHWMVHGFLGTLEPIHPGAG